ncbi:AraC family transcriptional regulator [Flavobacterium sp. CBA20B-1]|uniref:helix-turn-helix domain-containing protein n=1 Tax=unclassified Flavobacterium TaxID=196869 RepID=UPI002224BE66|nr:MULTISPECIES: AraC family transcriptional regulator [unclassified Flavobacterium]WCM42267.1 AraC family transcriptional regulator [Flavobacterium sp. CBA20B-1]
MVLEELRRRLLHMAFIKPASFQRYSSHYVVIINNEFEIVNTCESFAKHYKAELEELSGKSLLQLVDYETRTLLHEICNTSVAVAPPLKHIHLFTNQFLCSASQMAVNNTIAINLYQFHLHKEYFKASYEMTQTETARLLENKRHYEIIEKIKDYIDQLPLTVRVRMEEVVKEFGINSNLVQKLFKEQYSCSIYEYQISLRMDKAYYLICYTQKSFKEIAAETGYRQYSDFVKYFKQYYNILPGVLRAQRNQKKV